MTLLKPLPTNQPALQRWLIIMTLLGGTSALLVPWATEAHRPIMVGIAILAEVLSIILVGLVFWGLMVAHRDAQRKQHKDRAIQGAQEVLTNVLYMREQAIAEGSPELVQALEIQVLAAKAFVQSVQSS